MLVTFKMPVIQTLSGPIASVVFTRTLRDGRAVARGRYLESKRGSRWCAKDKDKDKPAFPVIASVGIEYRLLEEPDHYEISGYAYWEFTGDPGQCDVVNFNYIDGNEHAHGSEWPGEDGGDFYNYEGEIPPWAESAIVVSFPEIGILDLTIRTDSEVPGVWERSYPS